MAIEDLVTIARYSDSPEASMAKALLESHGIVGTAVGGELNNTLWHLGPTISGVELQVPADEAERAGEILHSFHESRSKSRPHLNWICPQCGEEVDAEFEVCWSCGTPFDQAGNTDVSLSSSTEENTAASPESWEKDQPVEESESVDDFEDEGPPSEADARANRVFKTAVLSIVFPLALPYALYQLLQLASEDLSGPALKKFYQATGIVLPLILMWVAFLTGF